MSSPILSTKLYAPPARARRVARPQLVRRLAEGLTRKLTLISAPAGFGKTTLLAECIAELTGPQLRFAWLSLDEGDDDARRFLTYLVAACQSVEREVGQSALTMLRSPQPPPADALLTDLINDLAQAPPFALVLDDYHVIHTPAIHEALTFLLDHLPASLHLVIATRSDPPLPVARLRARGELLELRAGELRFSDGEASAFLNQIMGLTLASDEVAALAARTEGWIAALQLAALSLQGRGDAREFISAFSGSHAYIVDYLLEEVLRRQPAATQEFLLTTSILERLCGSLCDALTLRGDGQATLERLLQQNLFVIPLDDRRLWFRYHHLFADVLRGRLHDTPPLFERLSELHGRASAWFEQHGLIADAVAHALAMRDWERVARLLEQHADQFIALGETASLQKWLDQLPPEVMLARPALSLARAQLYALAHQLAEAEQCLQAAERAAAPAGEPWLNRAAVERVIITLNGGDLPRTIERAQQALAQLPEDEPRLRGSVLLRLGIALLQTDHPAEAQQALAEAARLSQAAGDFLTALQAFDNQAGVLQVQGRLREAIALLEQALDLAARHGIGRLPTSFMQSDIGEYLYEQNDLPAARRHCLTALELGEQSWQPRAMTKAHLALARICQAQGDLGGASEELDGAEQFIRQYDLPLFFYGPAAAGRVRWWLAQGKVEAAAAWARDSGLSIDDKPDFLREVLHLALARTLIAQGAWERVIPFLARLRGAAEATGRMGSLIEILALDAIAHRGRGDRAGARAALERALRLGEPEGYVRMFVDEGEPMHSQIADCRSPLEERGSSQGLLAYVDRLLAAFGDTRSDVPAPSTIPPGLLSERELEVLRLMAAGASNQDIARSLVVTVNTVKRHVSNIFEKLAAHNRTQAVARGRELGLV